MAGRFEDHDLVKAFAQMARHADVFEKKIKPARLSEAAEYYGVPEQALRREAKAGRLHIARVAGKDWVMIEDIERLFKCPDRAKAPVSGSGPQSETPRATSSSPPDTSSKTADDKLALDAALATAKRLKSGSPTTSPRNTRRKDASVLYPKFGSAT
ncbi:hypothetical protein [Methylocystis suflitae]|uniref:hypothetical protein n=1 Tax=Methylocystis suflitae TaxID=2951405 RepID=UPI00210B15DB|nr:hypothetical protein [Methylocystis suflitae]MCQ4191024.1 hypothetical protein [Methylocystis suflitae]